MFISKFLIVIAFLAALVTVDARAEVRQPAFASSFYPEDSALLSITVKGHLREAAKQSAIDGDIIALLVPHAGLIYSGPVAGYAYSLLRGLDVETVFLCGPSHRFGFVGLSVYGPDIDWKTPLGTVSCDGDLCRQMIEESSLIDVVAPAHVREHSLEVQLPYLQTILDDFRIVPTVMGYQDSDAIEALSEALASVVPSQKAIMIASTDWQHYRSAEVGWKMDSLAIECVKNLDPDQLAKLLADQTVEMCGGGPAVAVMKAAISKGADAVKILKYGNSGEVSKDKSSVVGYVAAVLYKAGPRQSNGDSSNTETGNIEGGDAGEYLLTDSEKAQLLGVARRSIERHLAGESSGNDVVTGKLFEMGAAFVTLKKDGRLRGCIGYTEAIAPLVETVSNCSIAAAVSDRRFPPVTQDELPGLHIEISVLTPLVLVKSLDEITVGRDGLMITVGKKHGLLLPQVATDYGWDRAEFLRQTCRKAGLPVNTYQSSEAKIYSFRALVFGEK